MDNTLIVIADKDKNYICPLLQKVIQQYGQSVEIAVFTQKESLERFLREHFQITVLVASEEFEIRIPAECHIQHRVNLTDRNSEAKFAGKGRNVFFYRYSPLELLFHVISSYCGEVMEDRNGETEKTSVILVSSAAGGTGKTLVALALAVNLKNMGKRALYLDAEWLQNFSCYLQQGMPMTHNEERDFFRSEGKEEQLLQSLIRSEDSLSYLLQIDTPLVFADKTLAVYLNCINTLKNTGNYDYIIVDTDGTMDFFKTQMMGICNQLIFVTTPQSASEYAMKKVLTNLSFSRKNIHVIKNRISMDEADQMECEYKDRIADITFLPLFKRQAKEMLQAVAGHGDFQKLTFMLM